MYDNEYNRGVCTKLGQLNRKVIADENRMSNSNEGEHKITTRLEGLCMRRKGSMGGQDTRPPHSMIVGTKKIQLLAQR